MTIWVLLLFSISLRAKELGRHGDVRSVVFERDQFASSLNFYGESNYQDFLCPRDRKRDSFLCAFFQYSEMEVKA